MCTTTTTILTAVTQNNDEGNDNDNDGPFFDLEFAVPDESEAATQNHHEEARQEDDCDEDVRQEDDNSSDDEKSDDNEDRDGEFNFTISSGSRQDRTYDLNVTLSPSTAPPIPCFDLGSLDGTTYSSFSSPSHPRINCADYFEIFAELIWMEPRGLAGAIWNHGMFWICIKTK
ncbi:membrane-associated kinase regulator 2 [Pyrus ussuriensis x Pyrus communis]|uniref:Membrane-associated kinase regulator 2 n=1 Tax=Pyrus ussuriensis x Pyrus communis TaxID=2448454 RepID=A0A5N5H407_9ROSA|nr:membrane-associated kinase regulator 2 [Pyrus ussuriensis x Pyrus communis]